MRKVLASLLSAGLLLSGCAGESGDLSTWPEGASPRKIGDRAAENFASRDQEGRKYSRVCAWFGALRFAEKTGDAELRQRLAQGVSALDSDVSVSVDSQLYGIIPLELFKRSRDRRLLDLGKSYADREWEETTPDGITSEARYWVDDMYMITALQVQAYRATNERKYLDRAALTLVKYIEKLQQENGLFFHAPDSPYYWSRGNGWAAAGMTEILSSLPEDHPDRAKILASYRTLMSSLLKFQGRDGLWRQLIDHPEAWPETSGSGMFTFALATGVKKGWLDAGTFAPAVRKAWLGLVRYVDEDGNIGNVCTGLVKGHSESYYLSHSYRRGDPHGQAALLWAASALF